MKLSADNIDCFARMAYASTLASHLGPAGVKDHIGSSSFITDAIGYATQHLQYLPFGETFVDQQNGYKSRYTFSAKEKDDETQYSYFGARYYDSDLSVWLSVDNQCSNAPNLSPYTYCFNNPIKLVDPDGNWPWEPKNVREARGYARATGGDFERWTGRDKKTWASVDITHAENYRKTRNQSGAAAISKVFKPEGKSWGKAIGDFVKKIDEGGGADGALTGRITRQDAAVGLGVIGAMTGVGALIELSIAGAATSAYVIPALTTANSVDDAFTNSNHESGMQQMANSPEAKTYLGHVKTVVGILGVGSGISSISKGNPSVYEMSSAIIDAYNTYRSESFKPLEDNKTE